MASFSQSHVKETQSVLRTEKIDDTYSREVYGDFHVIIMTSNKYVNATKLCVMGGKRYGNWSASISAKTLIKKLEKKIGEKATIEELHSRDNELRGTYVHPDLVPIVASWVSDDFALYISKIINEWREVEQNEEKYMKELNMCLEIAKVENELSAKIEHIYRDYVAKKEKGKTEVKVRSGFVDVMTNKKIIEIKKANNYMCAIGQVLCYGIDYPEMEKWIYLFDHETVDKELIVENCKTFGIQVKFLEELAE